MKFTKMQGCGNDYIYVYTGDQEVNDRSGIAVRLSDRHFGIGGDGVIFINPSDEADFEMEMYNADGSRGNMCGNGIRCVAKFVYDNGLTDLNPVKIVSCGSVKTLYLNIADGKVDTVRVDMGEPILKACDIPADASHTATGTDGEGRLINVTYNVNGKDEKMTAVSMGNPHAVIFVDDTDSLELDKIGPAYEHHPAFPEGVNTEFVKVIDKSHLRMRVWERGSGETLACGTGACASLVAAVLTGRSERKAVLGLRGGDLVIEWNEEDGHIYMTGPARTVFTGEVAI
ncbi:MAG: diaminopimelate epimerase [Lachnospiraceae bacterium]|nr:diaminopimelate epimerase [Lachnospiraceae bacterium]